MAKEMEGGIMDGDWEEKLSEGFQGLMVQDQETGEVWYQSSSEDRKMDTKVLCGVKAKPQSSKCLLSAAINCWKVPKEYSRLGCSPSKSENKNDFPPSMGANYEKISQQTWTCETDSASDSTAIVATFPTTGKLPSFCRKRRCSTSSSSSKELTPKGNKETRKFAASNEMEWFLEGRERLLSVGRLLFAFLMLLCPGFFLSIGYCIKFFCHYRMHCENEEADLLKLYGSGNLLRSRPFLNYGCRICRDQLNREKMFRIHSTLKSSREQIIY